MLKIVCPRAWPTMASFHCTPNSDLSLWLNYPCASSNATLLKYLFMALFKIDLKIGKHIANKGTVDDMHTYVCRKHADLHCRNNVINAFINRSPCKILAEFPQLFIWLLCNCVAASKEFLFCSTIWFLILFAILIFPSFSFWFLLEER